MTNKYNVIICINDLNNIKFKNLKFRKSYIQENNTDFYLFLLLFFNNIKPFIFEKGIYINSLLSIFVQHFI